MAEYMHCSQYGSYYIPCTVIQRRRFNTETDLNSNQLMFKKVFGYYDKPTEEILGEIGFEIEYLDPWEGVEVTKWVPSQYISL